MIRNVNYKLVVYHDRDSGELYDLREDPGELENLWDHSDYADVRFRLLKLNFDALALAVDTGSKQVTTF
jgi:arylsulfatase A-like enzyme